MKKQLNHGQTLAGALLCLLSFFPAAALARESEDSGVVLPVTVAPHTHIEERDNEGISADATTTTQVEERAENDSFDNNDQTDEVDEATTTKQHQEGEHQALNSQHESDETDSEIEIDRDSAENASTTVNAPERVTNHGQLRSFLNHIMKEDDQIADVHVSSTTIETHYELPAKFLWAIPLHLTADVSLNNDGSVTVTYPWYAFLFAAQGSKLETQLRQTAASSTTLSASAQAHLLNLLFATLKSQVEK